MDLVQPFGGLTSLAAVALLWAALRTQAVERRATLRRYALHAPSGAGQRAPAQRLRRGATLLVATWPGYRHLVLIRPDASVAGDIAKQYLGVAPTSVVRFTTGIAHWVYEVVGPGDEKLVVRIGTAEQQDDFSGARHWSKRLRSLAVPLPQLLDAGTWSGLPYLVLERLPGKDLILVYEQLDARQKRRLAVEVSRIQQRVATLERGAGYGFVRLADGPGLGSWAEVIEQSLSRSRRRLEQAKILGSRVVDEVARHAQLLQPYLARIEPLPFLDDVTTKNVLVHDGVLSGIVDVDWICYGDPLFTLALTRASLLAAGRDLDYTDAWARKLAITPEQERAVCFYTALFCADFLSEVGHAFNNEAPAVDLAWAERVEGVLHAQLRTVSGR